MSTEESKDLVKEALKEAYKEVLQEHLARVGRWTISTVVLAALGLLLYLVAVKAGWTPPAR